MKRLAIALCMMALLTACEKAPLPPEPKFHEGQMVTTKVGGYKGMVVSVYYCEVRSIGCEYDVRFSAGEMFTNTHLAAKDGPITFAPLAMVGNMREYELEATQ